MTVGETIVSTKCPHDRILRETIGKLGLDWVILYNRQDAMALPPGVDKAFGLKCAAKELGISCDDIVSIGDAENDIPLVCCCGTGVAVSTAVAALKKKACMTVAHGSGTGVVELIRKMMAADPPAERAHRRRCSGT